MEVKDNTVIITGSSQSISCTAVYAFFKKKLLLSLLPEVRRVLYETNYFFSVINSYADRMFRRIGREQLSAGNHCRSGNRSKQAAQKLADLGYTNVVEFGGINDWPGDTVSGETH